MHAVAKKLRAFTDALPQTLLSDEDYVGTRIDETGTVVTVVTASTTRGTQLQSTLANLPSIVAVLQQEGLSLDFSTELPPSPQAAAAGSAGYGSGLQGYGTLGWFIILDGTLICISNHHVFCANGDETPIGTSVYAGFPNSGVRIGSLNYFDPLATANPRLFDFATAAIDDPSLVAAAFSACADGSTFPYPRRFGFDSDLSPTSVYATVGARPPTCATGKFRGLTSTRVGPYPGNRSYFFVEQLLFDPISNPGDSGSIVFERNSGRVLGLIFAGVDGVRSIANPLYRKGWTYLGTRAMSDFELPVFTSEPSQSRGDLQAMDAPPDLSSSPLPPIFQAGKNVASKSVSEWLRSYEIVDEGPIVVQPFGQWVHVRITVSSLPYRIPRQANAWLYVPTGLVYPF